MACDREGEDTAGTIIDCENKEGETIGCPVPERRRHGTGSSSPALARRQCTTGGGNGRGVTCWRVDDTLTRWLAGVLSL